MQHELIFNSSWPWWLLILIGGVGIVLVLSLYQRERREVSRTAGVLLTGLRLLLLLLLLVMLAEPVIRISSRTGTPRHIAVLLDDSYSMDIPDAQATQAERLRWADAVGLLPHDARPLRPLQIGGQLSILSRAADDLSDELRQLQLQVGRGNRPPQPLVDSLTDRVARLGPQLDRLNELTARLSSQTAFRDILPPPHQVRWDQIAGLMSKSIRPAGEALTKALKDLKPSDPDKETLPRLADQAHSLAQQCAGGVTLLNDPPPNANQPITDVIDASAAARLDAASAARLDRVAGMAREQIARELLLAHGGDLLARLRKAAGADSKTPFVVDVYRFAQTAARLPEANLVARPPSPDGAPPAAPDAADKPAPPGSERRTDPATAIDQVFANADGEHASVAAIIIITDGNFNADAPGDPGALARQRGVPIFPIRIGSTAPPPDLAVLKLDAPTSLYKDDTATVSAEVKMDGLAGREVTVALRQLDASGRPGAVLQTRTLHPTDAAQRGSVEFKFTPATTGTLGYTVTASLAGGVEFHDVMPDNDAQQFSMAVTDERTNVLLIDGPPRWEFRYLRGLLQRDRGVLVQHLVETPAFIRGQSVRDEAHIRYASVKLAREKDVSEVDSLPKTPEELFAFDVVVLGDISPDDLSELQQKMLDRFVSERGGTLICIAGKSFMPNAYRGRPLQELLPVKLEGPAPDAAEPVRPGVERKVTPFRVQLTDLGAASDLLRLAMEPAENQKVWDRTPPATWRLTDVQPKPSATVLAYAVDVQPPSQEKPKPDGDDDAKNADGAGDQDADAAAKAARERPLIVTQPYGLGQVMFLAWDRTWQLRFKVGDLYHHKLWAQVMRWATAARLPAGSDHVRLGTDRAYYRPGDRVTIRARLSRDDFTPVSDADVAADILCDGKVVQQVNLLPAASAPVADQGPGATSRPDAEGEAGKGGDGVFVARLGPLPGGRYRVKLHVNRAAGLTQNQSDDEVLADFAVAGDDPIESQQLAARSPVEIAAHGLVLTPATAALADQLLGQPVTWQVRIRELLLWSSWWLLGIFCGLAALEWIFRKRVGLI